MESTSSTSVYYECKKCSCDQGKKFICVQHFIQICKYCHKKLHNGCKYKWTKEFSIKKEQVFKQQIINYEIFNEQRENTLKEIKPLLQDCIMSQIQNKLHYLQTLIALCMKCRDYSIDEIGIKTLLQTKEIQKDLTQQLEQIEKDSNNEVFVLIQKFVNSGFQVNSQQEIAPIIQPSQIHMIKQSVFNFYVDYSIRCVLKMQVQTDIKEFQSEMNKNLDQKIHIVDEQIKSVEKSLGQVNNKFIKQWTLPDATEDTIEKYIGISEYKDYSNSDKYVIESKGYQYSNYLIKHKNTLISYDINTKNCCPKQWKIFCDDDDDYNDYIYVIQTSCTCGGHVVVRIPESYFE